MPDIHSIHPVQAVYIPCVDATLPAFPVDGDWLEEGKFYRYLGYVENAINHNEDSSFLIADILTNRPLQAAEGYKGYRSSRFDMSRALTIILN